MPLTARLKSTLRSLAGKEELDRDLDEELQSYLELLTQEKIDGGMSPREARREARLELGGVEQVKVQVRENRVGAAVLAYHVHQRTKRDRRPPRPGRVSGDDPEADPRAGTGPGRRRPAAGSRRRLVRFTPADPASLRDPAPRSGDLRERFSVPRDRGPGRLRPPRLAGNPGRLGDGPAG